MQRFTVKSKTPPAATFSYKWLNLGLLIGRLCNNYTSNLRLTSLLAFKGVIILGGDTLQ